MRIGIEDLIFILVFAFIGVLLIYALSLAAVSSIGDLECKRLEFREAQVTFDWEVYCIKRVDQTDVVKNLRELRNGR